MNELTTPAEGAVRVLENRAAMDFMPGGQALVIRDAEQYRAATAFLVECKTVAKRIEDERLAMTRPIDDSKARVKAFFDKLKAKPLAIVDKINQALNDYDRRQREAAAAAQREAQEAADRERRLAEARAARAVERGEFERAAELQASVAQVVTPEVRAAIPDVKGAAVRQVWKFRVTDPDAIPRKYMMPNETMIGGTVRVEKDKTAIPGIEVYMETTRSGTGR